MAFTKQGYFSWAGGGKNGAVVDAWLASRFTSFPAEDATPPSGTPDAGPVTTAITDGGPGSYLLTLPEVADYYIRAQYSGHSYWAVCTAGSILGNPATTAPEATINTTGGTINSGTTLFQGNNTITTCGLPAVPPNGTPVTFINQSSASQPANLAGQSGDTINNAGTVAGSLSIPYLGIISLVYFTNGNVWQVVNSQPFPI